MYCGLACGGPFVREGLSGGGTGLGDGINVIQIITLDVGAGTSATDEDLFHFLYLPLKKHCCCRLPLQLRFKRTISRRHTPAIGFGLIGLLVTIIYTIT